MRKNPVQLPTAPPPGVTCTTTARTVAGESVEELKAALRSLQDELIACQRVALLGSLTAMAVHEFNNLMTPIMARTEAALTCDDATFTRRTLERTLTYSQRAIALGKHLLDLVHDEDNALETCTAADAVREAIATAVRPFEKDGIELRVSVPEELQVRAREELLCQVLLNLLLNARLAMKETKGRLMITALAEGDFVQIDVCDSGRGIPADDIKNVLNPFLAADPHERPNDWQQVGLGLSVCRAITHGYGATLWASANEGRGCTFHLRWPRADAAFPTSAEGV